MNGFLMLITMIISFMLNKREVTCLGEDRTEVGAHCIETSSINVEKIIPDRIYKSHNLSPIFSNQSIELSFCPNINFLKVHLLFVDHLEGNIVILCYRETVSESIVTMVTNCYKIGLSHTEMAVVLDCWFPIHIQTHSEPLIEVWTSHENQPYNQYGSIRPHKLNNICTDECETTMINITSSVICYKPASIVFDQHINIHHITFHSDDVTTTCSTITIVNKTEVELEYKINCDIDGKGYIKVIYSINNKYCLKYQSIYTHCPRVVQHLDYQMRLDEAHSFGVFVLFGLGCMITMTSIIGTIVFTFQKFQPVWTRIRRKSEDLGYELKERDTDIQLSLDSLDNDDSPVKAVQTPVREVIKKAYIKRMDSYTSDGQSPPIQTKPVKVTKTRDVRKLHKCVTVALLEHTDELYRKRVIILPRPYDSFSRDATNLLQTVFTMEGGIPSQCCFDRDVYSQFITGDKHQWIQQTLSDRNKILVFLSFTSIVRDVKCNSMVTDILDHLVLSRINSHIFCKVIFLYITDKSDNLSKYHHGDSYYVNHPNAYRHFIENVLCFCGKNVETDSMLIHQLITCDASKHFLKFVGVKNIQ